MLQKCSTALGVRKSAVWPSVKAVKQNGNHEQYCIPLLRVCSKENVRLCAAVVLGEKDPDRAESGICQKANIHILVHI